MMPLVRNWTIENAVRFGLSVIVACLAGAQLYSLWASPAADIAGSGLFRDDAYFYSVLVDNYRRYGFYTMDGEMPTNGFQPLWMWVLQGLKTCSPDTPTVLFLSRGNYLFYLLFCALATFAVATGKPAPQIAKAVVLAGLLLLNGRFQKGVLLGLELPLSLTMVAVMLIAMEYAERQLRERRHLLLWGIALGALSSLCFFARTDLLWLPMMVLGWAYLVSGKNFKVVVAFALVCVALVLPYLGWNLLSQGSLMPISGRVKVYLLERYFTTSKAYWDSNSWHGVYSAFEVWFPIEKDEAPNIYLTSLILLGAFIVVWTSWGKRHFNAWLRPLSLSLILHMAFMYAFYRELRPYSSYYFLPELFFSAAVLANSIGAIRARYVSLLLTGGLLVLAIVHYDFFEIEPNGRWTTRVRAAYKLKSLVKPGEKAAAVWPGVFAQFSGLPLTPLDGIIGSNDYLNNYIKRDREIEYAIEHKIRYIITPLFPGILYDRPPFDDSEWVHKVLKSMREHRGQLRKVYSRGRWAILEVLPVAKEKFR